MKFAFSTVSCPQWDLPTIAARAREYGYDGVEIRASLDGSVLTASNVFLTQSSRTRDVFDSAGVKIACLASSIAMSGLRRKDRAAAEDVRRFIHVAREIGCPLVKILDTQVSPGQSRVSA